MPESGYPEVLVDDALAAVLAAVKPLDEVPVPFRDVLGLVLAREVRAGEPMPPFAASAKDGYALVAADGTAPRTLVGDVTAGRSTDLFVAPGSAARITTGAPLPAGADAVVMVEYTREIDGAVLIEHAVAAGQDVRPIGQDYRAGELLLPAGTVLGPAELGLLASIGARDVFVHRRPRVAVLSTGDELVQPGTTPAPGQIRDSNRFALLAAVTAAGAEAIDAGWLRDDPGDLARLAEAIHTSDAVVTSGGVSMGGLDLVKPWLAAHGDIVFGRVRTKPGKPLTFARVEGTPVFALPGFPVSSLVSFEVFVRPALRRMAGARDISRPCWTVRAGHAIEHAPDRTEFQRAVVTFEPDGPVARTTGAQGSGRLLSLSGANALLRLPEGRPDGAERTGVGPYPRSGLPPNPGPSSGTGARRGFGLRVAMAIYGFGRTIDYLRISLTDRCNLRCVYCMPTHGLTFHPSDELLTAQEIETVGRAAAELGFRKIRLTGGEPTLRRDVVDIVARLSAIPGITDLSMTTNGLRLPELAVPLARAGLQRVNIHIDTLDPANLRRIMRWGSLEDLWAGIEAAEAAGLEPIKLNAVIARGYNDGDVVELARLTVERDWTVRFIELMPLGAGEEAQLAIDRYVSNTEVAQRIEAELGPLEPLANTDPSDEARNFRLPGSRGRVGFISPVSAPYCGSCNRMRLTADGKFHLCLLHDDEIDLRAVLRSGGDEEAVRAVLSRAVAAKPTGHALHAGVHTEARRMHAIGG